MDLESLRREYLQGGLNRDELAAKCNYDVKTIVAASRERQESWGHKVVDLSKKKQTG